MSIPSIIVGEGNWAGKSGNLLGYAVSDVKIVPREFTVSRALNTATRVNVSGNIEGVNANIPRIDYFGGQASLLVEPSAVNLCPRSQDIDLWTPNSATVTTNAGISPDGTQNAELFVPTSGSNGLTVINVGTLANATTYTVTCFMKQHTASLDQISLYVSDSGHGLGTNRWGVFVNITGGFTLTNYTLGSGSVTSTSIENYGNGWYRIRVTGQVTSGMTSTSTVVIRYLGSTANGTNGVLVFGAQFELGSVPTSYIPTTTGTVTRNADVISVSGAVSGSIGQTEGTIYCELVASNFGAEKMLFQIDNGTATQRVAAFYGSAGNITFATASGSQYLLSGANLSLGTHKVALTYSSGNLTAYVNGAFYVSGTPSHFPSAALNNISLGSRINAGVYGIFLNDRIRAASIYQTRLPNTTTDGSPSLQSITTL